MVTAQRLHEVSHVSDLKPRRAATTAALDARLSVWGQAAREAAVRRAEALIDGVITYVSCVGRNATILEGREADAAQALLGQDEESLVLLSTALIPEAVVQSARLLWVDTDRLRERMNEALAPSIEAARAEVRRLQALYRRRARLWQDDQPRLNRLREEIESLRLPRCYEVTADQIAQGLLLRHKADANIDTVEPGEGAKCGLKIKPENMARWLADLEEQIENQQRAPIPLRTR